MTNEEKIQQALIGRFPFLEGKIRLQRARRIWVDVPAESFDEVFAFIVKDLTFPILCTMTGQDEGERLSILYHLAHMDGITLNLKVSVPRDKPEWKSVAAYFPGGVLYEREIADLFGVQFQGLPPGPRYPLPDDWPAGQYPLRKDWKGTGESQQAEVSA
jgi:Ni,Fe-hydrogenase III component G